MAGGKVGCWAGIDNGGGGTVAVVGAGTRGRGVGRERGGAVLEDAIDDCLEGLEGGGTTTGAFDEDATGGLGAGGSGVGAGIDSCFATFSFTFVGTLVWVTPGIANGGGKSDMICRNCS